MTIAIGLRCRGGIIVAADREEGDGYLKTDSGKIKVLFRGVQPIGQIAISGAGDAAHIDEISDILTKGFSDEGFDRNRLTETHRMYYQSQIVPLSASQQPPDYSLIIGCIGGEIGSGLYSTSRLAFNESKDYLAVGIGATVANGWLSKLYENVPPDQGAKLAAYILFQVKSSVGGCGYGTDIIVLKPNRFFEIVNPKVIRKWEDSFKEYRNLERNSLLYCLGVEDQEQFLLRSKPSKDAINSSLEEIRGTLTTPNTPT
jgi:20S proteasome alpha/beta subunit